MSPWLTRARRKAVATSAAALTLALVVGGCGSSGDQDTSDSSDKSGDAFPVTLNSSLGSAKIEEEPKRVVTLGQGSAETSIALGTTPVGVEEYKWGSDKTGHLPWVHEAVKKKGDKLPKQFQGGENLDVEEILKLEPDVILAPWSGITQKQFDVLNDIAPTVAYPGEAWSTDWDEQIDLIGKALGKTKQADGLKTDIERQFAKAAEKHPEYADVSFSYIYNDGPGTLGVFKPTEQRAEMVSSLGLKVDPVVKEFEETKGTDSALIGLENAHKLKDSDLIFTFYSDEKNREEIEKQPLYAKIPAIEKGAVVASDDNSFVTASSQINPLTVPWVIDRYTPMIDKALEKLDK
ncbi:iron-siderophore ABC transporter substrate-binding protein [Streptomyces oceani]|uniref:Iron ABC transporter substrate-binding protein n=1 Tax=Streptomyces oceani TaxID=1075402 RepID=A0A1E7KJQ6_9ACTN|nr:iron-siderophore ABC transporter substrate-binding protein [Streptomyces oceani]OEV04136.1 iron ABC transporter substrate-binding protein [Streptomyces oceani]